MKRYQCIKNWWTFTKGMISDAIDGPPSHEGGADLIGPHGRIYEVTKSQLAEHFQELLDLHVDEFPIPGDPHGTYWDHDSCEYVLIGHPPGCTRIGLAICVVVIFTVIALIIFS